MSLKSVAIVSATFLYAVMPCGLVAATEPMHVIIENISSPTDPASIIDATAVVNNGNIDFSVNTTTTGGGLNPQIYLWRSSNTRYFTNNGGRRMVGANGFRFDNTAGASSKQSAVFNNKSGGVVASVGTAGLNWLLINATNVYNQGLLSTGVEGLMRITGTNVDLSRGGLEITPIIPSGTFTLSNAYFPDVALYDYYWGLGNVVFDSSSPNFMGFFGPFPYIYSPAHAVVPFGLIQIGAFNPDHAIYTNTIYATDPITITNSTGQRQAVLVPETIVRQGVFVGGPDFDTSSLDAGFSVSYRFFPSSDLLNPMQTITVEIVNNETNLVTGQPIQTTLYVKDTLVSEPPTVLTRNLFDGTFRPSNFEVSRTPPFEYLFGGAGVSGLTDLLYYNPNMVSRVVTNFYSGYGVLVDNLASLPVAPWSDVTNQPGRIEIRADTLNMSQTRIRGEGLMMIEAKHINTGTNIQVDCQNLSYVLGSTNGDLNFQSLVKERAGRVNGALYNYSMSWKNFERFINTNFTGFPTNPVQFVLVTNLVEVLNHALIIDRSVLKSTIPVNVYNLRLNSTNIAFNDQAAVLNALILNGDSFTLNGGIYLTNTSVFNALTTFSAVNAPTLKYFTNNGTLEVLEVCHFGDDRPLPYTTFINNGNISAYAQQISATYYEDYGNISTVGSLGVRTFSGKLQGGISTCSGGAEFRASTLKFNQYTLSTLGSLNFSVTNALFDNGPDSGSVFNLAGGCSLAIKPATGDLLGTTIDSTALVYQDADHYWAAQDRGVTAAGFQDNVAIGRLALHTATFGRIVFHPVGGSNAIYVDELDLSFLTDYQNQIAINPGITVYFASSKGVPEETLDGQFGGQMRWVSSYAGPRSGVDVVINGNQTVRKNRALRNSQLIDSDADGTPNYWDLTPFDGIVISKVQLRQTAPNGLSMSWLGAAETAYKVEYTVNYQAASAWQTLGRVTNSLPTTNMLTIVDTNVPAAGVQRYYRVSYQP